MSTEGIAADTISNITVNSYISGRVLPTYQAILNIIRQNPHNKLEESCANLAKLLSTCLPQSKEENLIVASFKSINVNFADFNNTLFNAKMEHVLLTLGIGSLTAKALQPCNGFIFSYDKQSGHCIVNYTHRYTSDVKANYNGNNSSEFVAHGRGRGRGRGYSRGRSRGRGYSRGRGRGRNYSDPEFVTRSNYNRGQNQELVYHNVPDDNFDAAAKVIEDARKMGKASSSLTEAVNNNMDWANESEEKNDENENDDKYENEGDNEGDEPEEDTKVSKVNTKLKNETKTNANNPT
jgi:hypothetical protein